MNKIESLKPFPIDRLGKTEGLQKSETSLKKDQANQAGFSELLTGKLEPAKKLVPEATGSQELKFSAHAKSRLQSRGIELSAEDLVKMQEAIGRAGKKGSRESLLVTDKAAFVVSVKNNTVITAVDKESLKENVFTNIDSTILI